ncbi:hypothetical protein VHN57_00875 [Sphingobium sp. WW5]|uniref:hypothetical protein n=1 Tax=unclassified Sphingobium TaxID=2611147 RepID=UPI003C28D420
MKARDRHYLFVCSQNKLRSPTAEQIFADHDAETPLDDEMLRWAAQGSSASTYRTITPSWMRT